MSVAPLRGRIATPTPAWRQLVLLLVGMSLADLATTALALAWGAAERSPAGGPVHGAAGVAGLVALKVTALVVVGWLCRTRPSIGRPVAWGLTLMTAAAVTWNLHLLAAAYAASR